MEIVRNDHKKKEHHSSQKNLLRRKTLEEGDEVKLAAIALSLNMRLISAEMPFSMQERALRFTKSLLGLNLRCATSNLPRSAILASAIKKEFDLLYGPAWHCVVGKSFGSFITHSPGGFVYYSVDSLSFLLFKTEVQLVTEPPPS